MRNIRIRRENLQEWARVLSEASHSCEPQKGPASPDWGEYPIMGVQPMHPHYVEQGNMDPFMNIRISRSGNKAHKLWVAAGH